MKKDKIIPYLIQSAKFRKSYIPSKKGIDSILSMNYMGSAEFEFGALPQSLQVIRNNIADYQQVLMEIGSEKIIVFCNSKQLPLMQDIIEGLALQMFQLKERCSFPDLIFGSNYNDDDDFWWDIQNHFMFWKNNREFNEKFKKLISNSGR